MNDFLNGTVLKIQREFSLEDIRSRMEEIKGLGLDTVVVWPSIYWWEDKSHRDYPFHTGKRILDYAEELGLRIVMELAGQLTSLEYAPDYLMKDDYYPVKRDGTKELHHFGYGYLNYNHPGVKDLIKSTLQNTARQYRGYSALYAYDLWNETMFSSFDRYTLHQFRDWLEEKYGTIDEINRVWDRVYEDWSQIEFTQWTWASVMPLVDYNQFKKANVGIFLKEWSGYVKEIDPDHPLIADNISSMTAEEWSYERPHDDWNIADNSDLAGVSYYPKTLPGPAEDSVRSQVMTAVRSASRTGKFIISELQTHRRSMFDAFGGVKPSELRLWHWEAVSCGAKGVVYWKWEPFIKGLQTYGRGLVDSRGRATERSEEAGRMARLIGDNLKAFGEYAPEKARVAILYDGLNQDFIKAFCNDHEPSYARTLYNDSIKGLYKCLWKMNVAVDFIRAADIEQGKLADYALVFLTNQLTTGSAMIQSLLDFADGGGTLFTDGRFSVINREGLLFPQVPGGNGNGDFGYEVTDLEGWDKSILCGKGQGSFNAFHERQFLNVGANTRILAEYDDGLPAMVEHRRGRGRIIHGGTMVWLSYFHDNSPALESLVRDLLDNQDIPRYGYDKQDLRIRALEGRDGKLLFFFNYTDKAIETTAEMGDLTDLDNNRIIPASTPLTIPPRDVKLYRLDYK